MPSRRQIARELEDLNDEAVAHIAEQVQQLRARPSCCRPPGQRLRLVSDRGPVVRITSATVLQMQLAEVSSQQQRLVEAVRRVKHLLLKVQLDSETYLPQPATAPQATR